MNFKIETIDNYTIFTITDSTIEAQTSSEFKAKMLILAQSDISALIIDFSAVEVIDSSAIGALLLAYRELNKHNIPVVLVGVNTFITGLIRLTHLDEVFIMYPTTNVAIQKLEQEPPTTLV